jgi:hypothetical protein
VKEVTLLGQNVNSYAFLPGGDADRADAGAGEAAGTAGGASVAAGGGAGMAAGGAAGAGALGAGLETADDFFALLSRASSGVAAAAAGADTGNQAAAPSSDAASAAAGFYAKGFATRYAPERRRASAMRFAELLDRVAAINPEMRIRFISPHPKARVAKRRPPAG